MADIHPDALSLEDASIDSPPIQQNEPEQVAAAPETDDAEPEGAVDVQGRRMVDVSVLAAERKRIREATERSVREALAREYEPVKQKADEADHLRQALSEAQPYVEHLRRHPELLQAPPLEQQIPDDRAEWYARRFELYDTKTGQPDIARAKEILAEQKHEIEAAAQAAAQAAVRPITSQTAQQVSRQNFVSMATRRDAQNQPLVDAKVLAEFWAQLPAELTQHPEVGELILDAAIGKSYRTKGRTQAPERPPVVSEPAGGRSGPHYQMDRMAKHLAQHAGMSEKSFTEAAKKYVPGDVNILGD